jgi:hypothetical protein
MNGKWEQVFGGLLIVNLPSGTEYDVEGEINKLLNK